MKSLIKNGVLIKFNKNDLTSEGHFECLEQITKIGKRAFSKCTDLITVNLPQVIEIGPEAFSKCTYLTYCSFPRAFQIGCSAFTFCIRLIDCHLPQAKQIANSAFQGCTSLVHVTIPQVTQINSASFRSCINITSLVISPQFFSNPAVSRCYNLQRLIIDDINHPKHINSLRDSLSKTLPNTLKKTRISLLSDQVNHLWYIQQVLKQNIVSDMHQYIFGYSNQLTFFKQLPSPIPTIESKHVQNTLNLK